MITIPEPLKQFKNNTALRLAQAFELTRTDNTVYRYTDHDTTITLDDGNSYTPVDGFDDSAKSENLNLEKRQDAQLFGVISSSAITDEDLRAGLFRNAILDVKVVNWQYPWLGPIYTQRFFISSVSFTGERWEAKIQGIDYKLDGLIGKTYTRLCPYVFGDSDCTATVTSDSESVTTIVNQRISFTSSGLAGSQSDDFYKFGHITFTSGNNNGLTFHIKSYVDATGTVVLRTPSSFDFAVTDTFDIFEGCGKTRQICKDDKNNLVNFGGFPFLPGVDRASEALI
jgi:uncharacterized phage protein (TIGR02218 family)